MKRGIWDWTILKFLIVGVVNTVFGTIVMFSLYNLAGCSYWISSAANYILGSILSFFLNKYFTFQNRERSWGQVVRFTVNIAACYLVAYGVAKPAVRMLLSGQSVSIQENAAMLAGMCLFTGLNYFGQRLFAFR
ncbi:GtrA family protein [Yanshouia hominis]|uniref:GtrA family protein n=1 Tax=Yanshouia hominis TaxID=2763673 RepID=A0ABR7NMQ5_9FIRM|nr:GtrA family protein [Yanshouia hominis]MBC8577495.1 GtrA family protein [Yanshouia hominis]